MSGDVGCALARVRTLAAEYRLDPRRVVVMGSSAGGHLGLLAGYSPTVSSCGGDAVRPAAIVALYPPADLTSLAGADGWRYPEVVPDNTLHELMRSGPDTAPEAWREASPVTHVRAGAPPTLLLHGTHDQIVPVEQSRELERAGRTRGADIGLVELPFANHSYDLVWGGVNAQLGRGELARFLERTVGVRPPTG
ncbi:putative lipase/esterase [Pseudonocardia sp. Ae168_Ps1]|nr:putative lipase/esterase [Pseudonocardia sp. Ae150A_Ps1]OLL80507.1 putative lipase/esterase [Pseudonocardia sp. Ae168_Ps1]OLL85365.1 putative lipase/esterase [Pseudonocardia sp. Ae263_Ps1]OLL94608.1 putative lipase/esterase [Pseudonocardia sp. Ae356_Ps1]